MEPKSVNLTIKLTGTKFAALKMILAVTTETAQEFITRQIDEAFNAHRAEIEAILEKQTENAQP